MSVFQTNPQINLILNYQVPSCLSVIEIYYNPEIIDVLSSLEYTAPNYNKIPDALYPDNILSLKSMKKFAPRGRHNCCYTKTLAGKGRFYKDTKIKKGDYASLQNCKSIVRRLIVDGKLVAIDLINAHLEIIKNIASFLKIPIDNYKVLDEYCHNRDKILNDTMVAFDCDREVAKNHFITIIFGGSYDTWITHNNLLEKTSLKTDFMKRFECGLDYIKQEINKLDVMIGFKMLEKKINNKKDWKLERSALAIFLQEIESIILVVMYQYLESKGCIIRIPIHDGIWFEDCNNICNQDFLTELSAEIFDKLGLNIPLDYENTKPTDDDLKWFANHKSFYNLFNESKNYDKIIIETSNDDEGASIAVVNKFKDRLIRCNESLLVKENNCWISNPISVDRVLTRFVVESRIYFSGVNEKLYSYSKSVTHQKKCVSSIKNSDLIKVDDNFLLNLSSINKTYLPYLNGVWSMIDKKLYSYDELPNIHFLSIINRNLDIDLNEVIYNEFMNKVIIPILPNQVERDYLAHIISRSIAGHSEDKRWIGITGLRNAGKGVLTDCMSYAFGDYFGTFDAKCLVKVKNSNQDPSKILGWVLEHILTRSLWSNEIDADYKTELFNGVLIKILTGGDEITTRRLYENNTKIRLNFVPFILCNHMPNVEPLDALQNYTEFTLKSVFVSKSELHPDIPLYKLKNPKIKDDIKTDFYINAFTKWILNSYDEILPVPDCIIKSTLLATPDDISMSVDKFIIKSFKNATYKDKLFTTDILEILVENGYNISVKELHRLLSTCQIGIKKDGIRIGDVSKTGYTNIRYEKIKVNNNDDDIDE